jgi:hypothetical protein
MCYLKWSMPVALTETGIISCTCLFVFLEMLKADQTDFNPVQNIFYPFFVTFIKTDARNGNQDSIRIGGIPIRTMLFLQKQLYRQFRRIKAKLP